MAATKVKQQQLDSIILNDSIYRQGIINGGCLVGQRPTANLSTSKVYGMVDMIYGIAEGTVTAGTIAQITNSVIGVSGYAIKLAGVTLTGSGKAKIGFRMEAKNAVKFKNKTASFSCLVLHDVGSTKNYTIYVNKANASDNFSAVTAIENSGAIAVETATGTLIKFEDISLGDCSNGIEIIIECDCGAITTKNFEFTELQFNEGSEVLPFMSRGHEKELEDCYRSCQPIAVCNMRMIYYSANVLNFAYVLPKPMRATPVLAGSQVESTDFRVFNTALTQTTGFTLALGQANTRATEINATKTSHGLTDGFLNMQTANSLLISDL